MGIGSSIFLLTVIGSEIEREYDTAHVINLFTLLNKDLF